MPEQRIAIIGGVAEAASLAAKARRLRNNIPVHTTIFQSDEIGAAWDGRRGYTDGEQRLCTPPSGVLASQMLVASTAPSTKQSSRVFLESP